MQDEIFTKKTDDGKMIAEVLKVITDYGYEVTDADAAYVKGFLAHLQIQQQSEF